MKKCPTCGAVMIRASMYDPDGTVALHEGIKVWNEDGSGALIEWWVCIDKDCAVGIKNR